MERIGIKTWKEVKEEIKTEKRVKMLLEQKTLINIVRGLKKMNFVKKT